VFCLAIPAPEDKFRVHSPGLRVSSYELENQFQRTTTCGSNSTLYLHLNLLFKPALDNPLLILTSTALGTLQLHFKPVLTIPSTCPSILYPCFCHTRTITTDPLQPHLKKHKFRVQGPGSRVTKTVVQSMVPSSESWVMSSGFGV